MGSDKTWTGSCLDLLNGLNVDLSRLEGDHTMTSFVSAPRFSIFYIRYERGLFSRSVHKIKRDSMEVRVQSW